MIYQKYRARVEIDNEQIHTFVSEFLDNPSLATLEANGSRVEETFYEETAYFQDDGGSFTSVVDERTFQVDPFRVFLICQSSSHLTARLSTGEQLEDHSLSVSGDLTMTDLEAFQGKKVSHDAGLYIANNIGLVELELHD